MFDIATIVKAARKIDLKSDDHGVPPWWVLAGSVVIGIILILLAGSLLMQFLVCLLLASILYQNRWISSLLFYREDSRRTSTTLDAIVDLHWDWDLRTSIFTYHGRLTNLLGYTEDKGSDHLFWKQVIHPVDRPLQKYHLLRHLNDESIPYYCEYRLKGINGEYEWFAARGKVVERDSDDRPIRMVGGLEHIQKRKELEQKLIHAHKMEALGQLTGGIAHDFNNVLASLLGYAELALDSPLEANIRRYVEQIHQAGSRAKKVVRQLLDFSRTPLTETQAVNLEDEMREAIQMLRATLSSTVEIEESYPSDSRYARLDPNQLHRVLLNLGINARDAMDNKGTLSVCLESENVEVHTCSSCRAEFSGAYHVMRVQDDGEGFPEEIQDRLFDPFFTTKDFGKGTGMGLSVVHGIVHDYNGHIGLKYDPDKGTEISVYFPLLHQSGGESALAVETNGANRFRLSM